MNAKDEAAHVASEVSDRARVVKDVATDQVQDVARAVKEQARDTASEARYQARSLFEQARREVIDQAGGQQQRLSEGLRSFSSDLSSMADSDQGQGLAGAMTRQVADYLERAGDWLQQRDPAQALDEVSRYARRHPGTFMAIAAGLGLLAGRVARGAKEAGGDAEPNDTTDATRRPVAAPMRRQAPNIEGVGAAPSVTQTPSTRAGSPGAPDWAPVGGSTVDPLSTRPGGQA
ncbi:hypothetical protein EXU48_15520 [Occultella glacieicola]|uniref:Uncharacterized protein n=1 Tax=Occultella glacieicola TaxID=2518684 RepID=A0ABY2E0S8_9MICO|nr:hypothetical protein [Occultella glacieicola]TDE91554.1 hypothetical protein EXU48_15520 [Occultella glacieicola]